MVPIINLSSFQDIDVNVLQCGMDHCYINKHKYVKRDIVVELEHLASLVHDKVHSKRKESFHEFLRSFTNRFAQNIYQSKDDTFTRLHALRSNKEIVLLSGDKDSYISLSLRVTMYES